MKPPMNKKKKKKKKKATEESPWNGQWQDYWGNPYLDAMRQLCFVSVSFLDVFTVDFVEPIYAQWTLLP